MASIPVTYGDAKSELAYVLNNGMGVNSPELLPGVNAAVRELINDLPTVTPRGIWVGGVDRVQLTVAAGNIITLPSAYDTALEIEIPTANDINNGWFNDVDMSGLVDPDHANDVLMIRRGLDVNNNALYQVPGANVGDLVYVMAKRRFVAVTQDSDILPVWNVGAIVDYMFYIQKKRSRDNPQQAKLYQQDALSSMKAQLDGYLADPARHLARKAAYLADEKSYPSNSLGYVRARLALDLPNLLKVGKTNVTRGVNRIVERLVQRTNELRTAGRLRVKTGLSNLTFTRAVLPTDTLAVSDYEQIRALGISFLSQAVDPDSEKRAYDLLEAEETNALETLRHTQYADALQGFIAARQTLCLGYFYNRLQLEMPDGLRISDVEMKRSVNEADREATQRRNEVTASENGSDLDGPDVLIHVDALADTDLLTYPEYEIIKLLVMAQMPGGSADLKAEAEDKIGKGVVKALTQARNALWHCLIKLPRFTYGWMRATVGLGLADRGFNYPDAKIGRMVNDAEDALCRLPNFKNGEGNYALVTDAQGIVTLPADAERIIYADVCGMPLQTKHRSFEYIPIPSGYGVQPNFFSLFPNWNVFGPFGYRGRATLQDRGYDTNGNRTYYMAGCWINNVTDPTSAGANVNAVVKRRFLPKVVDTDVMLVQNVEAIRLRVESEIARLDGRGQDFEALRIASERAMDEQLLDEKAGEEVVPKFTMPGRSRGGIRTLYRRRF